MECILRTRDGFRRFVPAQYQLPCSSASSSSPGSTLAHFRTGGLAASWSPCCRRTLFFVAYPGLGTALRPVSRHCYETRGVLSIGSCKGAGIGMPSRTIPSAINSQAGSQRRMSSVNSCILFIIHGTNSVGQYFQARTFIGFPVPSFFSLFVFSPPLLLARPPCSQSF
ncbi:hypothetical protein LX32DRAFT_60236 [Colletotrichum zoysiae]|uniref:Uncharacterized protein n=1 Tax=Colletotrichum zoysiae TaxID=1216348 RepID=A0AAD9HR48_9PEZI|nr:hypothetical protein LX32DRAFT_60236 [Colletotrichum zoysiae]